ncbi:putative proline-rich receptor-like protein kinase PERK6 isoform X2 [Manihot esculenta]|nr:putative proline-rich receptor-like protein kinase PERK6 isoform X2 [Manihot esculenta]
MAAGRLRHRNLLQLDGYCIDGANTLLIFKYFSNGSLKYNLHGKENILDWKKRRNIALDSSRGLEYLHEVVPGQSKITHLNIKSDNILLDDNFLPKANPLIERALNREYADFVDSRLQSFDHEEMYRMIFCANICINQPPNSCPSMREIHLALQVSMPLGIALDEKKYNKLQLRATYKDDESSSYIEEENQRNNLEHYSYGELVEATEFFSNNRLVGEGASGAVYRGKLGKEVVAIKKFKIIVNEEQENLEDQFEIEVLTRIRHPNVVKLIGYCSEGSNRLLVLEYLMNKSLNSYLHGKKFLDWSSRLNIAIGSAKGILYLHKYGIIHRDIKTDNILLDNNLEPKIADFSLSKFLPNTDNISHITSVLKGTNIYVDPEYSSIQKVSAKSDIYSFGVVLLELITGRKLIDQQQNLDIITWTWREIEQAFGNGEYRAVVNSILQSYDEEKIKRMIVALVDSKLGKNYDEEQMKRMVFCAIACLNKYSKSRPRMQKIIEVLEGKIIPPQNILDGSDNKSIKYSRFRDN